MIPYIENTSSVIFFVNNQPNIYHRKNDNYQELIEKLEHGDEEGFEPFLISKTYFMGKVLKNYPDFSIENGILYYKEEAQEDYLSRKIVEFYEAGRPVEAQINFFLNVQKNPSSRARLEAYRFVEANSLPITSKGTFLAYKRIREDYTDTYSGTISNKVGTRVVMPRNKVNDDPTQTCSHGLHVCAFGYLQHFTGDRLVVTEQNPRDIVSVPIDYNGMKMRVCEYYVTSEIPLDTAENIWANTPYIENVDEDEDDAY